MNAVLMMEFLTQLSQNNNPEWFHANKALYTAAKQEFEALVEELLLNIRAFDESIPVVPAKTLTFKLMRDTRFSKDKSPYTPAFRAHIGMGGKAPVPVGYYIMLCPNGRSFLGGGLFADMFKDATKMVRDYIAAHPNHWQQLIASPDFQPYFTVQGTKLKNVPLGYSALHPQAEYLKHKSWYIQYPLLDNDILHPAFAQRTAQIFQKMQPFHDFLNQALAGFVLPKR